MLSQDWSCRWALTVHRCLQFLAELTIMAGFVSLSADRHMLELDGNPFLFCGANCYYLMVCCKT